MEEYIYNDIVKNIAQEFERELSSIMAVYNFDYGDEFEISVCKFLRRFLPLKYGICRGFVVDRHGNTAGDDIIIYDQELYPTLRFLDSDNQFAKKEQIPVEAVYAYIEAKHTLNSNSLKKAVKQVSDVKKLCYSRSVSFTIASYNGIHIFNNEYSRSNGWNPIISNPIYGMILSANCVDIKGNKAENGVDATTFLFHEIQNRGRIMATVPTQVRIDENLKKQASELFAQLGMDMSGAMNIFLRQCVLRGGLPFTVELPQYKPEVLDAMEEAKRISRDPKTKRYDSFSDALEDID